MSLAEVGFLRRWVGWNTVAFLVGYLLYTPIGHGITGGHDRDLTASQIIAHCVALLVVGVMVAAAQRRALGGVASVPRTRVLLAALGFTAAFWLGYYQTLLEGPDTDILLGYLVLGSAAWLGVVPSNRALGSLLLAVLSFPFASFVGELLLFAVVIATGATPEFSQNHLHHMAFWLTVGVTTGALGGLLSGLCLRRVLARSAAA